MSSDPRESRMLRTADAAADAEQLRRIAINCMYLGARRGELLCKNCPGSVRQPLYDCRRGHGQITPAYCAECPDREAKWQS